VNKTLYFDFPTLSKQIHPILPRAAPEKVVMVFGGEYDLACKRHLRSDLARIADSPDVVLEFTDVTYIDSTVIIELLRLHRGRATKGYPPLTIVLQNPQLLKLFALLHLEKKFHLVDDLCKIIPTMQGAIDLEYTSSGTQVSCASHGKIV
jgi:anti-anti-sigma regulatory factor